MLTPEFNAELAAETLRLNTALPHNPGQRYQGTHLDVRFDDNPFYDRLAKWQPARDALAAMGMDDFAGAGGLIVLTKEARAPTLYWHQVSLTLRSSLRRPLRRLSNTALFAGLDALERSSRHDAVAPDGTRSCSLSVSLSLSPKV